jgi:peptide/nickel transport system substrate-binding protein
MKNYSRRQFLVYGSAATGGLLVLGACSGSSGDGGRSGGSGSGLADIEGPELITDPSQFPSRFNERPEFAEMVARGDLPPVEQRIGQDPLVLRPLDDVGTYGGTLRRGFLAPQDAPNANNFLTGPDSLLYWDLAGENVVPNIARDFELSDDFTELTLHLRRGMRWSDGEPFTADDIIFWYEDIFLHPDLSPTSTSMKVGRENVVVQKVDQFTVVYRSPAPHPLLPALLAGGDWSVAGPSIQGQLGGGGYAAKHYLQQFHPKYTSQAAVDRMAREAGVDWVALFGIRNAWANNPDLPMLSPWIVKDPMNSPPWNFTANPYSIWVDTDGNQLPYIGEVTMSAAQSRDVLVLRAVSGEFDFQDRHLEVAQMPQLLDNEGRSDYSVHRSPMDRLDAAVRFNLAYDADPVIGELLQTVEFRRALSFGIDREQINETFFLGSSTPTAPTPSDTSIYALDEEWRTKWATLDVDQANDLLDGVGLTERDGDGFRQRPDGGGRLRLEYVATPGFADFPGIGEMIGQHWVDIGIELDVQEVDTTRILDMTLANQVMLTCLSGGSEDPFISPEGFLPTSTTGAGAVMGLPYAQWFASGGREGLEPPDSLAALTDAMDLYREGLQAPEDERIEIGRQIYMLHADNVWTIGLVGFGLAIYGIYIAKNNLGNVPERIRNATLIQRSPTNAFPMTFYYT